MKTNPFYIGYRILALAIVSYILLWFLSVKDMTQVLIPWNPPELMVLLFAICGFFILLTNLFVFPWDYSLFGQKTRHHKPNGKLIYSEDNTFGGIGWLYQVFGLVSFKIFEDGLLVCLEGAGDTFIKFTHVTDMETYKLFKKYRKAHPTHAIGGRIYHDSPEIRSPITVSQKTYDEIKKLVKPKKEREFY
jgi:hypothetical protein